MRNINVCPGTLISGYDTYSPTCLRKVFDGKKVSHIMDFSYKDSPEFLISSINRISISGVQEKLSAIIKKGKIIITPEGESGRYIIKPIPDYKHLRFRNNIPANEHLTMQIASQVYKIKTAENAMVFFSDGQPAYITKRFDYATDGSKIRQDDFASIAGKTERNNGKDFKYTGNYEDIARLLRQNVSAWQVEMTKYFTLVLFNYLFSNGDAHMKNFSLQETTDGDYVLTPAYDLMNTSIHVNDEDFALQGGLIPKNDYSDVYSQTNHPCKDDFITFGTRIGVLQSKLTSIINLFSTEQPKVYELIENSFLDDKVKRMYKQSYIERLHRFQRSDK
ncbi:HipA domain-containing protein [Bacteroides caecigallinarum]|uniref:type II toxin-antitoxin system HipA family toxin n=1 Tax=Bacteroides caecigallinarum TaxID=1411144 RepID=UPI0019566A19|nr:HipA domain-containing protein [Bacteroides caecigallinarum]MBM6865375.1 HipA domain-containing protein [Bacteroides caecigallinarum]